VTKFFSLFLVDSIVINCTGEDVALGLGSNIVLTEGDTILPDDLKVVVVVVATDPDLPKLLLIFLCQVH